MSSRNSGDVEATDLDKSYADNIEVVANADKPNPRKEAPAYVASLTPEEREKAEKALVRKIDLRLLPMLIIMYILNYLDRNNIVSTCVLRVPLVCAQWTVGMVTDILYTRLRLVLLVWKMIWVW